MFIFVNAEQVVNSYNTHNSLSVDIKQITVVGKTIILITALANTGGAKGDHVPLFKFLVMHYCIIIHRCILFSCLNIGLVHLYFYQ